MIVQCDKCGAKFQLADEKIGEKGAKVRCSKCKAVFTVTKAQDKTPSSPPPPPPPEGDASTSAPPPESEAKEDDPFADFNFSEDLDFEQEKDIAVEAPPKSEPPPPPSDPPGKEDSPSVSFSDSDQPGPAAGDDNFDFSDEEFSFAESAPAKPPPETADFGDISFDENSYAEPAPGPARPEAPPAGGEEWGNVEFSEAASEPPSRQTGAEVDEMGFGDFQFDADDRLPGGEGAEDDMSMEVGDFARSPASRARVGDDLEASIGEAEAESEPEKRPAPAADSSATPPPPPPPKPALSKRKEAADKTGGAGKNLLVIFLLILGLVGGGLAFTHFTGKFTVNDLMAMFTGQPAADPTTDEPVKPEPVKTEPLTGNVNPAGDIGIENVIHRSYRNPPPRQIVGVLKNETNKHISRLKVMAFLPETDNTEWSYCGNSVPDLILRGAPREVILAELQADTAKAIAPGETCQFTIVLFNVPEERVGEIRVKKIETADFEHR